MKAIFINGSPRKNKNTAQMLESAMTRDLIRNSYEIVKAKYTKKK